MGIKKLYSYCKYRISNACHAIDVIDDILTFKEIQGRSPRLIINLSTISYAQFNLKNLLAGYQLNQLKVNFEEFLSKLQSAGAHLEFVIKKPNVHDENFLKRRLQDYRTACDIIDAIRATPDLDQLNKNLQNINSFPFNVTILATLVQSAQKFGAVHCQHESNGIPAIAQIQLAKKLNIDWIIGLDTYYFVFGRGLKIFSDGEFTLEGQKLLEIDTRVVLDHLKLNDKEIPLFAALTTIAGDTSSYNKNGESELVTSLQKKFEFGTRSYFQNVTKYVKTFQTSFDVDATAKRVVDDVIKSEGAKDEFVEELTSLLQKFGMSQQVDEKQIEFSNFGDAILAGEAIFLSPVFMDLRCDDVKNLFELVKPLLCKTAGAMMQTSEFRVITLESHDGNFVEIELKPEIPSQPFDFFSSVLGMPGYLQTEISMEIPAEFLLDVYVLLYLLKNESIRLIEARIMMATLAQLRKIEGVDTCEYPKLVNERAFRLSFLFSKVYFYFISCLNALKITNISAEFRFDGVYFQKVYQMNMQDGLKDVKFEDAGKIEIVRDFASIIRNGIDETRQ